MSNYEKTELVLKMFYGDNNHVVLDDKGLPSVMVYIPKFKISDVLSGGSDTVHPAFIVDGVEKDGIYISKYQNIIHNDRAYSFPGEAPATGLDLDTALNSSFAKGAGWHLMTAAEWAAVALWTKKNCPLPKGNNHLGKDMNESEYSAVPATYDANGNPNIVATGTGPIEWSHDGTMSGIWDLNGNIWEWQGGLRLVSGELQILENNNAANIGNSQGADSMLWKAISASDGSLVEPNSDGTIKLDVVNGLWTFSANLTDSQNAGRVEYFGNVTCTADISDAAKELLRALALLPEDGANAEDYENDKVWCNNGATEAYTLRGAHYTDYGDAGIFALNIQNPRTRTSAVIGFRSAYYA